MNLLIYLISPSVRYNSSSLQPLPPSRGWHLHPLGLWYLPTGHSSMWLPSSLCSGSAFPCKALPLVSAPLKMLALKSCTRPATPHRDALVSSTQGLVPQHWSTTFCRYTHHSVQASRTTWVYHIHWCSSSLWFHTQPWLLLLPYCKRIPCLPSGFWTELFKKGKEKRRGKERWKYSIKYNNQMTMRGPNLSTNANNWSDNYINRNLRPG